MPYKTDYRKQKELSQKEEEAYDEQMRLKYKVIFNYGCGQIYDDQNITTLKFIDMFDFIDKQTYKMRAVSCHNIKFTRVAQCVTNLQIRYCDLLKLDGIRQWKQLKKLSISNRDTPFQLQELQYLTNLQTLRIESSQVTDITPLKYLIKLQELSLFQNNIHDIEPLKNLKELITLELTDNQIIDLSPLQDLVNMDSLSLENNPVVHINALRNLSKLQRYLNLSQTYVQDFTPIEHHDRDFWHNRDLRNIKQPTKEIIKHSLNYKYIQHMKDTLKLYLNTETYFKNRIQLFNKKIAKPYKAALKYMRNFSEQILNLFKQLETDGSFDQ
ncbi:leucine-rich_repeat domain-containing protein [Hexamita inflata]|uniref:Leucine-rich repeat domain-containing protein n=1 Tax=Hexamita inflata TaxID=28002 RepID=A0AA86NTN1_9EUKA|nr:leucine-rich repeat domain-containing protein [Hexamita inflata]